MEAYGTGATGPVSQVSAYLANADLPVEEAELAAEITSYGWARTVTVANDTFALLRTGLSDRGEPVGVAVVCGAGINCVGLGHDGRTARFPSIGRISGAGAVARHLAEEACGGRRGPTTGAASRARWPARFRPTSG
ncbi:hypothetical protein SRIMM317S_04654 [Streptomyces rimosus subsp. rimosus]